MSTNKQRREAERARLQRQLEQRRQREAAHKRFATVASIVGALVLVAAIVVVVVVATSGSDSKSKPKAGGTSPATTADTSQPSAPASTPAAAPDVPVPTAPCSKAPAGDTARFAGLTITGVTNLKAAPKVTGKASGADPTSLTCDDLVVGSGKAATTSSQATVEYVGLVYKTGKVFQSSWDSSPATFGLSPQDVIPGFSQGIAGAGKVAPMKEGGRRVIIMPAATAYGANPPSGSGIPANAALVFIVDLQKLAA